ncbi:MAG TPA: 2-dehydro-3-deoxy-D-gluconate 5-dehydrogenase KduD [Acidobacteriaceae bacterium]
MILDSFSLKGKTALVTGSSRGLGAGIAIALAEAGAQVALHDHPKFSPDATHATIKAAGGRSAIFTADLSDVHTCDGLIDGVVKEFGTIDILVNNAGIIRRAPAVDHSMEDWMAVININLTAVFRLTQLAGKHMLAQGSGKVINTASLLAFQGGVLVPGYAAAKGGVAQLTKAFANEWAGKGINVNAIAPGYMATDNTAPLRADAERSKAILERIPAGRWGTPADVAAPVVFLASAASDYVNGHVLVIDGGWLAR